MMDYQVFKEVISGRLKEELPPIFSDYEVKTMPVRKVNKTKDAITLIPPECTRAIAVPTLYMDEMYELFEACEDLDKVMEDIVSIFITYTGFDLPLNDDLDFRSKTDMLVMNLISTEMNNELLKDAPHTEYLDMSVVYRFIMSADETGFGTVLLTNELLHDLKMDPDTLHRLALENTQRLFPAIITRAFENFYIMTNEHVLHGATTIASRKSLAELGSKIGCDYYIIPASIHEVYAVPAHLHTTENLLNMLKEGNHSCADAEEILSSSIYRYSVEDETLDIAGTYSL